MVALGVLAVGTLAFAGEGRVVQGTVKAVCDKTVTVADQAGVVQTFEVTQGVKVYATGAGHKWRMLLASGRKATLDDFVQEGQRVTVHFREQSGTLYITRVHVHGLTARS